MSSENTALQLAKDIEYYSSSLVLAKKFRDKLLVILREGSSVLGLYSYETCYYHAVRKLYAMSEPKPKTFRLLYTQGQWFHKVLTDVGLLTCERPTWSAQTIEVIDEGLVRRVPVAHIAYPEPIKSIHQILNENRGTPAVNAWIAVLMLGVVGVKMTDLLDLRHNSFYYHNNRMYFRRDGYYIIPIPKKYAVYLSAFLAEISKYYKDSDYIFNYPDCKTRGQVKYRLLAEFSQAIKLKNKRIKTLKDISMLHRHSQAFSVSKGRSIWGSRRKPIPRKNINKHNTRLAMRKTQNNLVISAAMRRAMAQPD